MYNISLKSTHFLNVLIKFIVKHTIEKKLKISRAFFTVWIFKQEVMHAEFMCILNFDKTNFTIIHN